MCTDIIPLKRNKTSIFSECEYLQHPSFSFFLLFLSFYLARPFTKTKQQEIVIHRYHQSQQRLHSHVTQLNYQNFSDNRWLFISLLCLQLHSTSCPLGIKVKQINHHLVSIAIGKPLGNTQGAVIPVLLLFTAVLKIFSI